MSGMRPCSPTTCFVKRKVYLYARKTRFTNAIKIAGLSGQSRVCANKATHDLLYRQLTRLVNPQSFQIS